MRVALLAYNAPPHNAVGNQIAEKVRFFQERGAEVRLFVQDARRLHPDLGGHTAQVTTPSVAGPEWDYLCQADLVFAVYAQYHDLLQWLPCLTGTGPRIVFDYLGVTPPELWRLAERARLESSVRSRGHVWCADHALTMSQDSRRELLDATGFPPRDVTMLPLLVDVDRFRPQPQSRYLQHRLGIAGPIVLFVGRLAGNKRTPLLIEALSRLGDKSLHAVLVGACSDIYAEEAACCLQLARALGIADRVHLVGELSDEELPWAYRSADVLVMPSRHEGFCVPVLEAMASGCPVLASRSAALPETVGDAGLTFTPEDPADLARQIQRILADTPDTPTPNERRRVAIVSFRFGAEIVGGAETSLRTLAQALQTSGWQVEIFTTCATTESRWTNDAAAGTVRLDGLTVHRFPIDAHDPGTHGEIVRAIVEADGLVDVEMARRYLASSIHSTALLDALRGRRSEFAAIVAGPYLFGLTADIAREFRGQALVVPCFHDEPLARLPLWPTLYGEAGGILYHSVEEKRFAETRLGVNHPNAAVMGTVLASPPRPEDTGAELPRPYVVYCGRYSAQKNVPLLLEWARRYRAAHADGLDFVFMGSGDVKLPREPWLHDLGRLAENDKQAVLRNARALVQLSTQESLSLVALEAWAVGTPVIAHADCAVLAGHIERSGGGAVVADAAAFAELLTELQADEPARCQRGANGRAYVLATYADAATFVSTVVRCIDRTRQPLREQMRERGLERARVFCRARWQEQFAEFVEQVLTRPARACRAELRVEALRPAFQATRASGMLLIPVRLINAGTHAAVPDGPGATALCVEIRDPHDHAVTATTRERIPAPLLPGQAQVAAASTALPAEPGEYCIRLWLEGGAKSAVATTSLLVLGDEAKVCGVGTAVFLDAIAGTLPRMHQLQQLPTDYVDVTEGTLAPLKRAVKRKLLHNFKHAYVDVLARQQSQLNGQLVLMVQQLAECCAALDHAVAQLGDRVTRLDARLDEVTAACGFASGSPETLQQTDGRVHG